MVHSELGVPISATCRVVCQYLAVLCCSVSGSWFRSRNLEEGGCSLYRYRGQKPSGAKGRITSSESISSSCRLISRPSMLFILVFCPVTLQDYKPEEDPCRYKSVKTGRGPLGPDWKVQRLVPDESVSSSASKTMKGLGLDLRPRCFKL